MAVALLFVSNLVMLYAWYGHLRTMAGAPVWAVVLVSWAIALVEYCFMIPANRIGSKTMTLEQLKIVQEAVALLAFVPFSPTRTSGLVVVWKKNPVFSKPAAQFLKFLKAELGDFTRE